MNKLELRPLQERTCPRCGLVHAGSKSWCASCASEYSAAYRKAHAERLRAAKAAHYQSNKDEYKARAKGWKSKNPESVSMSAKKYYEKNKETESARLKKWEMENTERRAAAKRKWRQDNKHLLACQCRARQARAIMATPRWADAERIRVEYELARWCGLVVGEPFHVDHIVPLRGRNVCGLHVHYNMQVIPASANLSKGNRHE